MIGTVKHKCHKNKTLVPVPDDKKNKNNNTFVLYPMKNNLSID